MEEHIIMNREAGEETRDDPWRTLHKTGGISALAISVLLIGEVLVYGLVPNPASPEEYLGLFLGHPLSGLLYFDLLGMVSYIFFIPVILSLCTLLWKRSGPAMLLAAALFFLGVAIFFATNTGFPMLSLSRQYALLETEAEREALLVSCRTMITLFNVQAFMLSYIIVSASWAILGFTMLGSGLFSRFNAWMGILAGTAGIIAEILENSLRAFPLVAIAIYFSAIVFLFLWVLLTGIRLRHTDAHPHQFEITNRGDTVIPD